MDRVKVLIVFVNEVDRFHDEPLYKAIVQRLRHLGAPGVTVVRGMMGFGHHHRVHGKGLLGISDDRPLMVVAVAAPERIAALVADLRSMVREGLMLVVDGDAEPLPIEPASP